MKTKLIGLVVSLLVIAGLAIGGDGSYQKYNDAYNIPMTSDDAGDSSIVTGTIAIGPVYGYSSLHGIFTVQNAKPGYAGLGNADSCILTLYAVYKSGTSTLRTALGTATTASLPASLTVVEHSNVGDTSLYDALELDYAIHDTLGDTAISFLFPAHWNVTLK